MPNVKVPCTPPIVGHGGPITEIEIREPTLGDIMDLGEPFAYSQTPSGQVFATEVTSTVRAYYERCLVSPSDPLVVEQASLKTGRAVKAAILGFFREGGSTAADSKTSGTTSSGEQKSSAQTTSSE